MSIERVYVGSAGRGEGKEAAQRASFRKQERWVESVAIFALKVEEIYFDEQFSEEVFTSREPLPWPWP